MLANHVDESLRHGRHIDLFHCLAVRIGNLKALPPRVVHETVTQGFRTILAIQIEAELRQHRKSHIVRP